MKKILAVVIAILAMGLFVNFAFADVDVDVNNDNTNTNTNNNANTNTLNQSQNQNQNADANANNSLTIENPREFLVAPGFNSFLHSGTALESGQWQIYCPPVYKTMSLKELKNMERKFQFSDIFPWNWKQRIHATKVGDGLPSNSDDVVCIDYWPKVAAYSTDRVLATARILGDPNWPEEVYLGMAELICKDISGSRRVAMQVRLHKDGVTIGKSLGLSGATSKVSGDEGVAFVGGGQLGNNRTRVEDYVEFEILCLNDGPYQAALEVIEKPKAPPVTVTKKIKLEKSYTRSSMSWTGCPDKKPNPRAKNIRREEVTEQWVEEVFSPASEGKGEIK